MKTIQNIFVITLLSLSLMLPVSAQAAAKKGSGNISYVKTLTNDLVVSGKSYKLSPLVKVYGLPGNKYTAVKSLSPGMNINFAYSRKQGADVVSEIWVMPE